MQAAGTGTSGCLFLLYAHFLSAVKDMKKQEFSRKNFFPEKEKAC